jgi:hypothetical protein
MDQIRPLFIFNVSINDVSIDNVSINNIGVDNVSINNVSINNVLSYKKIIIFLQLIYIQITNNFF